MFTALFFLGSASGSAIAGASFVAGGWRLTSHIGLVLAAGAFILYLRELVSAQRRQGPPARE